MSPISLINDGNPNDCPTPICEEFIITIISKFLIDVVTPRRVTFICKYIAVTTDVSTVCYKANRKNIKPKDIKVE